MVVYFGIVLDERRLVSSKSASWQAKPYWVFGFLGLLFVAEFFMGGVLDIQVYGAGFFNGMMFASTAGSFVNALSAGFFNFIMFFTRITMSPWYLIMMGIEMGALVAFRIKYTRELETKVRLLLLILAYGVYSILLPVFLIPAQLPQADPMARLEHGNRKLRRHSSNRFNGVARRISDQRHPFLSFR